MISTNFEKNICFKKKHCFPHQKAKTIQNTLFKYYKQYLGKLISFSRTLSRVKTQICTRKTKETIFPNDRQARREVVEQTDLTAVQPNKN